MLTCPQDIAYLLCVHDDEVLLSLGHTQNYTASKATALIDAIVVALSSCIHRELRCGIHLRPHHELKASRSCWCRGHDATL
eukprot:scaffold1248_cov393-Prasinococcus_capsulatus_cf.AAC.36